MPNENNVRTDCINLINQLIKDENVKSFIFLDNHKQSDFLTSTRSIINYYNNIMCLAFVYAFARFSVWKEKVDIDEETNLNTYQNSFIRVISNLSEIYKNTSFSFEMIESLLMSIQIDQAVGNRQQKNIENELDMRGDFDITREFNDFAYDARNVRRSARYTSDKTVDEHIDNLAKLISMFPFLGNIEFVFEDLPHVRVSSHPDALDFQKVKLKYRRNRNREDQILDTNMTLIHFNNSYYLLERAEIDNDAKNNHHSLALNYFQPGSSIPITLVIYNSDEKFSADEDDFLLTYETAYDEYSLQIKGFQTTEEQDFLIKDVHTINYKYLKHLAFAVADILNETSRRALNQEYAHKFPDILGTGNINTYYPNSIRRSNWDTKLILLFIEDSASNVLKVIFRSYEDHFQELIHNLGYRVGVRFSSRIILSEYLRIEKQIAKKWKTTYWGQIESNSAEYGGEAFLKNYSLMISELRARYIISKLAQIFFGYDKDDEQISYPISILSQIDFIKETAKSNQSIEDKTLIIRDICNKNLKTILVFYKGFFAYAKKKKEFENETLYRIVSQDEVARYQQLANDDFEEEIKNESRELKKDKYRAIAPVLDRVKAYNDDSMNRNSFPENYLILTETLGRTKILNFSILEYFYHCFDNITNKGDFDVMVKGVLNVFTYLQTGIDTDEAITFGAIFPYIGTYEFVNHSGDGYHISHFSIFNEDSNYEKVQVLSEFKYALNNKYFCLPNQLRSNQNNNIWIEPIIINYERFAAYFDLKIEEL